MAIPSSAAFVLPVVCQQAGPRSCLEYTANRSHPFIILNRNDAALDCLGDDEAGW
jgi:hypothetical protein